MRRKEENMIRLKLADILPMILVFFVVSCSPEPSKIQKSQDELIDKWRPAVGIYYIMDVICTTMSTETGKGRVGPDGESMEQSIHTAIRAYLDLVYDAYNAWDPAPSMERYKSDGMASLNRMDDFHSQWTDEEITTDVFLKNISAECDLLSEKMGNLLDAAEEDGLTTESLDNILTSLIGVLSE
jgi:hypothetical protein